MDDRPLLFGFTMYRRTDFIWVSDERGAAPQVLTLVIMPSCRVSQRYSGFVRACVRMLATGDTKTSVSTLPVLLLMVLVLVIIIPINNNR